MEQSDAEIGAKVRKAREAKGLTRAALASAVGLNQQYIYQIESGIRHARLEVLWDLATALDADPHSFDARLTPRSRKRKDGDE
jgi:transcriptional regulator with XRE-family HTH domain